MRDIYKVYLQSWERTYIIDNTNANLKTARLLKIPHIGCYNNHFNLDKKNMIENTTLLDTIINGIKNTMTQAKKLKNTTILRTIIDLQLEIDNARFSSMFKILQKYIQIRSEIIVASFHHDSNIEIHDSTILRIIIE